MAAPSHSAIVIGGTLAIDHVKTPADEAAGLLGGSAAYAALAASYFTAPVHLVGIVGADFPPAHLAMLARHGVALDGVERSPGASFSWSGEYHADLNTRTTHATAVNVLETWSPRVPPAATTAPLVVLANMSPDNQLAVLAQCKSDEWRVTSDEQERAPAQPEGSSTRHPSLVTRHPPFVIADTMNLWIDIARPRLLELLQQVDLLVLNDSEARELTGADSLLAAVDALLAHGPRHLVVKLGEHGALLASRGTDAAPGGTSVPPGTTPSERSEPDLRHSSLPTRPSPLLFRTPAVPLRTIVDPTGAGDSFLGAMAGFLAAHLPATRAAATPASPPAPCDFSFSLLSAAVLHGTAAASFTCEAFSTRRLENLTPADFAARLATLRQLTAWPEKEMLKS